MVLVKKWPFFLLSFLGNISQENVFYDILQRKNAFLGYKNKKFKTSKNWHFSKGLTHGFAQKWPFFFYDIQERNNTFLSYKNKKFKKSKKWHFSKGVNQWFWSKNGHYSTFLFLGNIGQEKVFYHILELNSAFLGYKNKKFKKSKN